MNNLKWKYNDLQKWIGSGCNNDDAINVILLNCSEEHLTVLPPEIGQLINLQIFYCHRNQLTVLPQEIGNLINLQQLDCYSNQLTVLPPEIGNLINLQTFNCLDNRLTVLPPEIGNLINLQIFNCYMNQFIVLPPEIGKLTNLQSFDCSRNQITVIPTIISNLINLEIFSCHSNQLTTLPPEIGYLINLRIFHYTYNEIEYIPPNVLRLINRLHIQYIKNQGIYNDAQSVHNHNIQKCIIKCINYIMSQVPDINFEQLNEYIINNEILNDNTKQLLFEYIANDEIHSIIGLSFKELLLNTISLINKNKYKNEILNILNTELLDAECKCFTGRISRLVNCLNGFDENIQIQITDNEQIANIILQIRTQYEGNVELIKTKASERLKELGHTQEIIDQWIEHMD